MIRLIRAPTRGATPDWAALDGHGAGFNPCAHAGRDPKNKNLDAHTSLIVSIRAPTRGATAYL